MKRFSQDAIKARLVARAKLDADSATILDDSAFNRVLDVFCEGLSEVARYLEYNTMEKKWTNAHNLTSLTHMGKLIGKKRRRPISSIGYVLVSHTDDNGSNRLANYGKYFFDVDQASDFDNIEQNINANYIEKAALVPWVSSDVYTIPKYSIFKTASGVQFLSTQSISSRILSNPYRDIIANANKYNNFISSGGWDGIKYLKVPVIQGSLQEVNLGVTKGERFEVFQIHASNVEAASNTISRDFFTIEIVPQSSNIKTEKWVEIANIRLAGPYDKVFETKLSEDGESVIIKFGDGISGFIPPAGSTVKCTYLETLGEGGNVEQAGQITQMAFPTGYSMIDPRKNVASTFLSCTNIVAISGGRNIEDEEEYRINAPTSYLDSYTTAVKAIYEKKIRENSPVLLSKLKCFSDVNFNASKIDDDKKIDSEVINGLTVANELTIVSNSLKVTAIKANGKKFDNATVDEEFIKPILKIIGDLKGPNDSISYQEPNFIKIAPSIKINTFDTTKTEEDIYSEVATAVQTKYSIFNTDFRKPLYSSELIHLASIFKYTDSVNMLIEAIADISYDKEKIVILNTRADGDKIKMTSSSWNNSKADSIGSLVAIPFKFDKIFSSNKYRQGFKNCSVSSNYLLKVDIRFINNSARKSDSKTLFLYDNRKSEDVSLENCKKLNIDGTEIAAKNTITSLQSKIGIPQLDFFDDTDDKFNNRQVRVAQFQLIQDITDEEFMSKAKSFQTAPFENRPFEILSNGEKKRFNSFDVDTSLRMPIVEGGSTSKVCYKLNKNWVPYIDVVFNENYDDPNSVLYASGYVILPLSWLKLIDMNSDKTQALLMETLSRNLKQYLDIKVYAVPKQEDFELNSWQDIIFVDDDDIKVEKNIKFQ